MKLGYLKFIFNHQTSLQYVLIFGSVLFILLLKPMVRKTKEHRFARPTVTS